MGGGGTPSVSLAPPAQPMQTYSLQDQLNASIAANKAYLDQLPPTALALADANRQSGALDLRQFVSLLNRPGDVIYDQEIDARRDRVTAQESAVRELEALRGGSGTFTHPRTGQKVFAPEGTNATKYIQDLKDQIAKDTKAIASLPKYDPETTYKAAFGDIAKRQDALIGGLESNLAPTRQYQDLQKALGQDYSGTRMRPTDLKAEQAGIVNTPGAALADRVRNVSATEVGAGAVGNELMDEALGRVRNAGKLTGEANRDAVQAARRGMAARGMAAGNAGLAAELLNRDRYSRQRGFEDLNFAQGVQAQNLDRQFANVGNRLRADQQNQQIGAQMSLADQNARNQMSAMGYQGMIGQRQFNTGLQQNTNILNSQRDLDALTYNNALGVELQGRNLANAFQQANLADSERLRQLGVGEALIGQQQSRNPMMLLLGAQQPNNQIAGLAAQTAMGGMGMGAQGYSFGINQNNSMWNAYNNNRAALQSASMQAGAAGQSGMMGMMGGIGGGLLTGAGLAI